MSHRRRDDRVTLVPKILAPRRYREYVALAKLVFFLVLLIGVAFGCQVKACHELHPERDFVACLRQSR